MQVGLSLQLAIFMIKCEIEYIDTHVVGLDYENKVARGAELD